jgi:hypothetical protein
MDDEQLMKRCSEIMRQLNPMIFDLTFKIIKNEEPKVALGVLSVIGVKMCAISMVIAESQDISAETHRERLFDDVGDRYDETFAETQIMFN